VDSRACFRHWPNNMVGASARSTVGLLAALPARQVHTVSPTQRVVLTRAQSQTEAEGARTIVAFSGAESCKKAWRADESRIASKLQRLSEFTESHPAVIFSSLQEIVRVHSEVRRMDIFVTGFAARIFDGDHGFVGTVSNHTAACWAHIPEDLLLTAFDQGATDVSVEGGAMRAIVHLTAVALDGLWERLVQALKQIGQDLGDLLSDNRVVAARIGDRVDTLQRFLTDDARRSRNTPGMFPNYKEIALVTEMLLMDVFEALDASTRKSEDVD